MPRKDIPIPNLDPDFRTMTEKDLRLGITQINRALKEMAKQSDSYPFLIDDLRDLRKRYKQVWRARPGRAFHDVAARKQWEKQRHILNGDYIPPFGL